MKRLFYTAFFAVIAAVALNAAADGVTGFEMIKEGNKYVADPAKDKVISLHSEKSTGETTPKTWHVLYFDRTTSFKTTRVKLVDGQMTEVKHPTRIGVNLAPMDKDKLKVDSDRALATALKQPMLNKLAVKATEITLENDDNGPTWKIKLWAAKSGDSTKLVDIGDVQVSAESGKILKNDLHLNRAS